jgi:hypothetical protein
LENGNRFIPVTTTVCWNFQEAAMAHWMNDDEIIFNDVRDGKFRAVVMNWHTKKERVLPMPVSAVSEDRTWAVSVNYARLSLLRPDYGYAGPGQDAREDVTWPEDRRNEADIVRRRHPFATARTKGRCRKAGASARLPLPYRHI